MSFKASQGLRAFLKEQEGFRETVGKDTDGKPIIGFGQQIPEGSPLKNIDQDEAHRLLEDRISLAERELAPHIRRNDLTQGQIDAVIDAHYNMGLGSMRSNGVIDAVNSNDPKAFINLNRKLTRGRNEAGEMVEIEGLKNRVAARERLWLSATAPAAPQEMLAQREEAEPEELGVVDRVIDFFTGGDPLPDEDPDLDMALESVPVAPVEGDIRPGLDSALATAVSRPTPDPIAQRVAGLNNAADIADEAEALRNQLARNLVDKTGITLDEASSLLVDATPEDLEMEFKRQFMAEYFPQVSQWASNPDNYVLAKKTGNFTTQLAQSVAPINKQTQSDWERAVRANTQMFETAIIHSRMTLGEMSVSEGKRALKELDSRRGEAQIIENAPGAKRIGQAMEALTFQKMLEGFRDIGDTNTPLLNDAIKIFDGSVESAQKVLALMKQVAVNPEAAALMIAQSAGIALPGIAAGATGFALGGIPGAALSYLAADAISTSTVSYGAYLQEQLQQFADPRTGEIDYDAAFSDPKRVAVWRAQAAAYGGVMAGGEFLATKLAGKFLAKPVLSAVSKTAEKTVTQKAVGLAVGAGKEVVVQGATEAGQELASRTAARGAGTLADAKDDKIEELSLVGLEKDLKEATLEGVLGGPGGLAMGAAGALIRNATVITVDTAKRKLHKTVKTADDANTANKNLNALQGIRERKESEPASAENPQQVEELIDLSSEPPPIPPEVSSKVSDVSDAEVQAEIERMDKSEGVVSLAPSDLDAYFFNQGLDPALEMSKFGPEVLDAYSRNRASDTSFSMPLGAWMRYTQGDAPIDAIARVNGAEMNAIEGADAYDRLVTKPFDLFEMAYHGSPYRFDKFSMEAIGTGEGNQAFGHGLYFSSDRDVAEWYRKGLSRQNTSMVKDGKVVEGLALLKEYFKPGREVPGYSGMDRVVSFNTDVNGDWSVTVERDGVRRVHRTVPSRDSFTKVLGAEGFTQDEGQLYEVNLDVEKDHMLDWDKPLSQQSEYVREKLSRLVTVDEVSDGEAIYGQVANSPERSSALLRELGVIGIKYTASSGKENYVIFDDSMVQIQNTFYEQDGPPPLPGEEGINIEVVEGLSDAILRPVELVQQGRSEEEQQIFKSILGRLKASTKLAKGVDPESLDILAELQFRHLRQRADMLGRPFEEVAGKFKIGKVRAAEGQDVSGTFQAPAEADGPYKVAFSEGATTKTLVHELGHSWLYEMSQDYDHVQGIPEQNLTPEQRDYKEVMDIAADLLGLDNIGALYTLSPSEITHIQETFAQTTEKYFLEGTFANSKVRHLMESFRKWMTKIAELVGKTYPQHPALKITPEVERLFDVLLAVSDKVDSEVIPMFPEPLFDPAILGSPETAQRYIDAYGDARSQAVAEFYGKAMRVSVREREKLIDAQSVQAYDMAEAEIDELPSMQMLKSFQDANEAYKKQGGTEPRISYQSFVEVFANRSEEKADEFLRLLPRAFVAPKKKGGIDAGRFMQTIGVSDPFLVMDMFVEAGRRDQMIEQRAQEIFNTEFPSLKTDEELHKIAVDAVNKQGKEKILMAELKILAQNDFTALRKAAATAIIPPQEIARATREQISNDAYEVVLNSKVNRFTPNTFLRDSGRQGRKASRAFYKGDILRTFEFKRKEAVAFFAFKAARAAQVEMAKTMAIAKNFDVFRRNPSENAKSRDVDVMGFGSVILDLVRKGETKLPLMDTLVISANSGLSPDQVTLINDMIADFNLSVKTAGNNMTVGDFLVFGRVLSKIEFVAKAAKAVEIEGQTVQLVEAVDRIINEVGPRQESDPSEDRRDQRFYQYTQDVMNLNSALASLFPNDLAYAQSQLAAVINNPRNAEAEYNMKLEEGRKKFADALAEASKEDLSFQAIVAPIVNRVPFVRSIDKSSRPYAAPEIGDGVFFRNKGEIMYAALLMGSDSGAKKLIMGGFNNSGQIGGIDPETGLLDESKMQAFLERAWEDGTLTKKDYEAMQVLWDFFEELYPLSKEAMRKTDGINLGYIKGRAVVTPFGTYQGRYVPVAQWTELPGQNMAQELLTPDHKDFRPAMLFPMMNTRWSKNRTQKVYPVDLDLSRVTLQMAAVAKVAYLRAPMMDTGRVLRNPQVMQALEDRRPGIVGRQIIPWYRRTNDQQYTLPAKNVVDVAARHIRQNANVALYLWNLGTVITQGIGLVPAIPIVGAGRLLKSAARLAVNPIDGPSEVAAKSRRMADRLSSSQARVVQSLEELSLNSDYITRTKDFTKWMTFVVIQAAQNRVDTIIWHAAYEKAFADSPGITEAQAVRFADNVVADTQSDAAPSSMANIQEGSDAYKLMFTMVTSVPVAQANLAYKDILRADGKKQLSAALVRQTAFIVAIPTIIGILIQQATKLSTLEDEEERKRRRQSQAQKDADFRDEVALQFASTFLDNAFPVLGRIPSMMISRGSVQTSPALSRLGDAGRGVISLKKSVFNDIDMSSRELHDLLTAFTLATGLPSSALGKMLRFIETPEEAQAKKRTRRLQQQAARRERQ